MQKLMEGQIGKDIFIDPEQAQVVRDRIAFHKTPPIKLHVLLANHSGSSKNPSKFQTAFARSDIWMPEAPEWNAKLLSDYRAVSAGTLSLDDYFENHSLAKCEQANDRMKTLHGSNKRVAFVDMPQESELYNENPRRRGMRYKVRDAQTPNELLWQLQTNAERDARFHRARETMMLLDLPHEVWEFFDMNPQCATRDAINVLFTLGSYHSDIVPAAQSAGIETTTDAEDPTELEQMDPVSILRRRIIMGEEIDEQDVSLAMLANEIISYQDHVTIPESISPVDIHIEQRSLDTAGRFSPEERKNLLFELLVSHIGAQRVHYWQLLIAELQEQIDAKA